jgi:hypothetical protein
LRWATTSQSALVKLKRELDRANLRLKQRPTLLCLCRHVVRTAIKSFHPDHNQGVSFSAHEVTQKLLDTLRVLLVFCFVLRPTQGPLITLHGCRPGVAPPLLLSKFVWSRTTQKALWRCVARPALPPVRAPLPPNDNFTRRTRRVQGQGIPGHQPRRERQGHRPVSSRPSHPAL